jgi:hypothetical protein
LLQLIRVLSESDYALQEVSRIEITESGAYECDRIDHGGVAGDKEQEGNLDSVGFSYCSGFDLLSA